MSKKAEKLLAGLVRRHLGGSAVLGGWVGPVQVEPGEGVAFGQRTLALDERLRCEVGGRFWFLSPARPALLAPPNSQAVAAAEGGRLLVGFDFPGADDELPAGGARGAESLALFIPLEESQRLLLDRLRTRRWSPAVGAGPVPDGVVPLRLTPADPETEWLGDDAPPDNPLGFPQVLSDAVGGAAAPAFGERCFVHLPLSLFRGLRRSSGPGRPPLYWLSVAWPEGAEEAARALRNRLLLNVVPYCDRVFQRLEPSVVRWSGNIVVIPADQDHFPDREQAVRILHVEDVDGASRTVYHDARHALDPGLATYRLRGPRRGTEAPRHLARLVFPARRNLWVWLAYHAREEDFGPREAGRLDPEDAPRGRHPPGQVAVRGGRVLSDPRLGWKGLSDADTWEAFRHLLTARGRCVTPHDFRAAVRAFDLFGLNARVDAAAVVFRRGYRRYEGAFLPCTDVVVPLRKDHGLSETDLACAREELERHLAERGGLDARLRVRWEGE